MVMDLMAAEIHFNYGSTTAAEAVDMEATNCLLEPSTVIDITGRGSLEDGDGTPADDHYGAGAGAATVGGAGAANYGSEAGGAAHGNMFEPTKDGSRGGARGTTKGGRGGGAGLVKVGKIFDLDGSFLADGVSGPQLSGTGGGAGGSVWIVANHMKGYGAISANGGAGEGCELPACDPRPTTAAADGGGGAGGRIAMEVEDNFEYRGEHIAVGGGAVIAPEHLSVPVTETGKVYSGAPVGTHTWLSDNSDWRYGIYFAGFPQGFYPPLGEYWYSNGFVRGVAHTQINRWKDGKNLLPAVKIPQASIVQISADEDRFYYTANWELRTVSKFGPFPSTKKQWEWKLSSAKEVNWGSAEESGEYISGVCAYDSKVYVSLYQSPRIFILNKDSGEEIIYKRPDGTLKERL
eukprot:gene30451-12263_t